MGDTSIQWTDKTWGLLPVLEQDVMSGNKLARPIAGIELQHRLPASTAAIYQWIRIALFAAVGIFSMENSMFGNGGHYLNVFRSIIGLLFVQVVNDLAREQWSPEFLFRYQTMLIYITAHVCQPVAGHSKNHIAIRSNRTSSAPIWISFTRMNNAHTFRVASCNHCWQGVSNG